MQLQKWLMDWLDVYVKPCRAASTASGYAFAFSHFSPPFMGADIASITPLDIQREINTISAEYPRQAQIALVGLRRALKKALVLGMIPKDIWTIVEPPKARKKDIDFYDAPQLAALLRAARPLPSYRALLLMALLGLRRGEALGLMYGDIRDGHAHIWHQRRPDGQTAELKTLASNRILVVAPQLRALLGDGPADRLICPVSCTALYRDLAVALRAAQLPHITPHGLRHTYASLALHGGASMRLLQGLLGHAHFSVTADTYCHIYEPDLDAAGLLVAGEILHAGARLEIV